MLQVKHLVKRYVTKGGTVTALDDVSVTFPEKGMVFLLGKSGSGKSTLLNLSGGLDSPDEGEVIVKGKSSKDFSKSDFDSYRNTFVGFIFQEYNILNELTVAENVALAIELQGKKCEEGQVEALLKQVDLAEYGDRHPNTLSGGQKQRVAIARALVKNPEIIMADEPTGALDSNTGKQVFDTLKKLSEEKLVVIVSHDRDFAESYADRIIELSDGKVISDVSRGEEWDHQTNLVEISEKKIAVNCGTALSAEDEQRVLAFLRKNKGSVVISADKEDMAGSENGGHVGFGKTKNVEEPDYNGKETTFIKSKFPMRYAVKMGVSGLKLKPLRLIFTTLLATIAFIVFGIFSTLVTYDITALGANTLSSSTYSAAVLTKHGVAHMNNAGNEYTTKITTGNKTAHFSQSEIEELQGKYPKMGFIPAYTFNKSSLSFTGNQGSNNNNDYYGEIRTFTAFCDAYNIKEYLDDENSQVMQLVAGSYPTSSAECLISEVVYESFVQNGYVNSAGESYKIESYEDLIGKQIRILVGTNRYFYFNVTGVVDTFEDFSEYDQLKTGLTGSGMTRSQYNEFADEFAERFKYSLASLCYCGGGEGETLYDKNSDCDEYVNGSRSVDSLMSTYKSEYFVSSKYLVDNGDGTYSVNEEAEADGSYIQYLFASLHENRSYKCKILMRIDNADNDSLDIDYEAPYSFMSDIRTSEDTFDQIFVILGSAAVILAVFAALLLFNFISASINAKKKDIGILRAVGARGVDVFKIFIVEGVAITLFCFALGCLGSILACAVTNSILVSYGVLSFQLFNFGWLNVLILLGIAFVTAFVATEIPVALTVRKKPVEAIRSI